MIYKCGKGEIPDLSRKISRGGGKFQGFSRHRIMVWKFQAMYEPCYIKDLKSENSSEKR